MKTVTLSVASRETVNKRFLAAFEGKAHTSRSNRRNCCSRRLRKCVGTSSKPSRGSGRYLFVRLLVAWGET
jgi:hypothetical protein